MKHYSLWLIYHVKIPIPKLFPQPIITRENSAMNQSEFLAIARNLFKAREKLRMHKIFKPITKRSTCKHVITFYRYLIAAQIIFNKKEMMFT